MALQGLDNLKDLFGNIISRLETLEAKVGVSGAPAASAPASAAAAPTGTSPAVEAYDAYLSASVTPFVQACDALSGLKNTGSLAQQAFQGNRKLIVLASRSKPPVGDVGPALAPYLSDVQEAVKQIRALRLDRDYDRHYKAVMEALACLSWILFKAPQQMPGNVVKEAVGSAEFWSNRIRKDFKGKDDKQIAFCDTLRGMLNGLVAYIEAHHKTGLTWNPAKGIPLADAAKLPDDAAQAPAAAAKPKPASGGFNLGGVMAELNNRKSNDGSSAATGLKKVTKDQQTWRKEYKGGDGPTPGAKAPAPAPAAKKFGGGGPKKGKPVFEYQSRGFKWVIEHQTKETVAAISSDGILTVEIADPKQQVYLYNCEGITVKINGKFKSMALDTCVKTAVVYDSLISSAEVVNSKKIQLQVNGVCPVFTIDKTNGFTVWLSKESKDISTFTTSLSSEMNVSYPDGDDMKEVPIPEQFVHKIGTGKVTSEVSDLYH